MAREKAMAGVQHGAAVSRARLELILSKRFTYADGAIFEGQWAEARLC